MLWAGHVASMGNKGNAWKFFVRNSERQSQIGKSRRKWEDNIKTDVKGVGPEDLNSLEPFQNEVQWMESVNTLM
jgi:hypothetical protein